MLNGHVDVVPVGDPAAWSTPDPFSGRVVGGELHGRGACDMKAGLVAALAAVSRGTPVRRPACAATCCSPASPGEEDGGLGTYATLRRGWTRRRLRGPRADRAATW